MKTLPEFAAELGLNECMVRRLFTSGQLPEPPRMRGMRMIDHQTGEDIIAALVAAGKLKAAPSSNCAEAVA